jgi:16S rRNA processing protein RimM
MVGRFGRPRGVDGELYITPTTDDPGRFLDLTAVFVVVQGKREQLLLERVVMAGDRPVVKVAGFDTREQAGRLTNLTIEIPIAQARPLPEGSYYLFELEGCSVVGVDGTAYGIVEEVLQYPANDVYRIQSDRFGEVLLPAVERFVKKIDIDARRIVIDPPKGLFAMDGDESHGESDVAD